MLRNNGNIVFLLLIVIKFHEVMKSAPKKENNTQNHLQRKWTEYNRSRVKLYVLTHADWRRLFHEALTKFNCSMFNHVTLQMHIHYTHGSIWFTLKMEKPGNFLLSCNKISICKRRWKSSKLKSHKIDKMSMTTI